MFMLSAVIVGVTLSVRNQSPAEGTWNSSITYGFVINHPTGGHMIGLGRMTVPITVPTGVSNPTLGFLQVSNVIASNISGGQADVSLTITLPALASGLGWSGATTLNWSGRMNLSTTMEINVSFPTAQHIVHTNVTTTATLRRTDTNATIPWSNTGAPNLNVTINALTWLGTPTPPANHSFDGWSPATRTVNRGNGTNHGILDFTPIFTPLAPTIHLARFYLHGGNIDGQMDFYDVPQIDGMRTPQPRNPQKDGYAFRGWFTEQHGGDPFNFLQPKISNQTIHAQWELLTGNVVILHFAGGLSHNETVWYFNTSRPYTLRLPGADIMNQNPPTPGQVFLGWFDNVERVGVPVVLISGDASGPQLLWARWG